MLVRAAKVNDFSKSCSVPTKSKSTISKSNLPASIFEKSKTSLTNLKSDLPDTLTVCAGRPFYFKGQLPQIKYFYDLLVLYSAAIKTAQHENIFFDFDQVAIKKSQLG